MKESVWQENLQQRLEKELIENLEDLENPETKFKILSGKRLIYSSIIYGYNMEDFSPIYTGKKSTSKYQTDLMVCEISDGVMIPRVIIELKQLKKDTNGNIYGLHTHDGIEYNEKAKRHKTVHPYLRYGMAINGVPGDDTQQDVPWRLLTNSVFFDFVINLRHDDDEINGENNLEDFDKLKGFITQQVKTSIKLERLYKSEDKISSFQKKIEWDE
jgi:hypothetical protein